jgi:hypothetical protein
MGILDDAIREHLDLKRKHGAPGDDIERLEKEAFGPPTRPGDPDFEQAPEAEAEPGEAAPEETGEWSPVAEEPGGEGQPPAGAEAEGDPTPSEQARADYSHLDDTVDHPAVPGPDSEEDEQEPVSEPAEAPEAAIFDAEEEGDAEPGDFELDPGQDPGAAIVETPPGDQEEELDFNLELDDETAADRPPDPVSEPGSEPRFEADDDQEDALEDEDEDVLEETPEFLEDTPEGERLWFEQGEPKDFDFDE